MNIGLFLRGLFSLLLFQSLNTFFLQICCIPTLPEHVEDIRRLRERLGRSHHHLLDVVHTASGDQGIHTEFREKKEERREYIYSAHQWNSPSTSEIPGNKDFGFSGISHVRLRAEF